MKIERLSDFLDRALPARIFATEIDSEVRAYVKAGEIKGASMPIHVSGSVPIKVGRSAILVICDAFLDGSLTAAHVRYICDALQLKETVEFESENVREVIGRLTDPEINGSIDVQIVSTIKAEVASPGPSRRRQVRN